MPENNGTKRVSRRKFVKGAAGGEALLTTPRAATGQGGIQAKGSPEDSSAPRFSGRQLERIAFPLGGMAAGSISLGGRGQLRDWEIFNRPDNAKSPTYAFPCIWAKVGSGNPVARVLESRVAPPHEGAPAWAGETLPARPGWKGRRSLVSFQLPGSISKTVSCRSGRTWRLSRRSSRWRRKTPASRGLCCAIG